MDALFECIQKYYPIGKEAQEHLAKVVKKISLPKNSLLVTEGTVCKQLYFLEQGCARGYYNLDGKEVTYWFGFENDFITSFYSFISRKPGIENIQLLEDAVMFSISYDDIQKLFDTHHDIERMVRIIYERSYIRLEERLIRLQFKTAKERYDQVLENNPQILNRVNLGQLASFLGISQETLSRIRAKS